MNEHLVPKLKITLAMIIVGSSIVAGKLIVQSFPVFLASELRFLVASMILVPLLLKLEGFPSIHRRDLAILFGQAFCGVFLFSIFMLYGLKLTTALEGGIITSTIPAVIGGLAFLILKEKISKHIGLGIVLSVLGTLAISISGTFTSVERGSFPLLGNVLIFGAVMGEALFIILGKSVLHRVSPLAISTIVSVCGVIMFLPCAIYEAGQFNFRQVSVAEWGMIVYLGLVVTVVAFILMYQEISLFHFLGIYLVLVAIYFSSKESQNVAQEKIQAQS